MVSIMIHEITLWNVIGIFRHTSVLWQQKLKNVLCVGCNMKLLTSTMQTSGMSIPYNLFHLIRIPDVSAVINSFHDTCQKITLHVTCTVRIDMYTLTVHKQNKDDWHSGLHYEDTKSQMYTQPGLSSVRHTWKGSTMNLFKKIILTWNISYQGLHFLWAGLSFPSLLISHTLFECCSTIYSYRRGVLI